PPQRGVTEHNVEPFATLVEELDHFLCIAERAASGRPTTLLELELHANVSKHLVLSRFAAGASRRLGEERRGWLRRRLFEDAEDPRLDPARRTRYRDAAALALSFLGSLERMGAERRVATLRRFHRLSSGGKLELISGLV